MQPPYSGLLHGLIDCCIPPPQVREHSP